METMTGTLNDQMMQVAEAKDLDRGTATTLVEIFRGAVSIDDDVKAQALAIVVTDESQVDLMAQAREKRLELRAQRIEVENIRKDKKDVHLRIGQVIDGMAKVLKDEIVPLEEHLGAQENYAKVQEEKREAARREAADKLLAEQEEAERLEKEEDDKRVREENARLKAESESRDKKENERRAADQKIADEKAAKARGDAERSRQAAVQREREKAERETENRRLEHVKLTTAHIAEVSEGTIGGLPQPFGILIYELEEKISLEGFSDEDAAEATLAIETAVSGFEEQMSHVAEKREQREQEELLLARQVKCPDCGMVFDSTEHLANKGE